MPGFALFAQNYWNAFVDHWTGAFKHQSAIVLVALGVAALGILIIVGIKSKK